MQNKKKSSVPEVMLDNSDGKKRVVQMLQRKRVYFF